MKLTALGVGSAFATQNYNSNFLLEYNGRNLLIDCGGDIRLSLKAAGYAVKDIQGVFVSHLHADHAGGLEYLAFASYFGKLDRPILIGRHRVIQDYWAGAVHSLQYANNRMLELEDFFNVRIIPDNGLFEFNNLDLLACPAVHVQNEVGRMMSDGIKFVTPNADIVYISGDTQQIVQSNLEEADLVLHECETYNGRSNVHTHYDDLRKLPADLKAKMWLYHYQDGPLPDAQADGFKGFLKQGQVIDL